MSPKDSWIIKTLIFINSVFLIIIIFFTPLAYYIFNLDYYENLYENNDVFSILNKNDVLNVTEKIFDFFKYKSELDLSDYNTRVRFSNENISVVPIFTPDEINHFKDVRSLLLKIFILYCTSIVLFIILSFFIIKRETGNFFKNFSILFMISSVVVLFFILLLYFLGNNFPVLFENFHEIFFPQGNYTFPSGSLIITIFPFGFFYDFFKNIILGSAVLSVVILAAGIIFIITDRLRKKNKIKNNKTLRKQLKTGR